MASSTMSKKPKFIQTASDDDSITTASTADPDSDAEYPVEKVLLEERNSNDNKMHYLVKWEGYPLGDATWEELNNDEHGTILAQWAEQKAAIAKGDKQPFDRDEYTQAFSERYNEKQNRKQRREAKRRRRLQKQSKAPVNDDFAAPSQTTTSPKARNDTDALDASAKRFQLPARPASNRNTKEAEQSQSNKKKGLARPIRTRVLFTSDDEDFGVDGDDSDHESVSVRQKNSAAAARSISSSTVPSKQGSNRAGTSPSKKTASSENPTSGSSKMATDVRRKQRPRVSGETPKQSAESQFRNLAELGRYQKYGAQNEPPPDPSKLIMLDAKTGKPQSSPAKLPSRSHEHSHALGTRPKPESSERPQTQPIGRQREPSPPAQNVTGRYSGLDNISRELATDARPGAVRFRKDNTLLSHNSTPKATIDHSDDSSSSLSKNRPGDILGIRKTCPSWAAGNCSETGDTCHRAHVWADPRILGPKNVTCHFWRTRRSCAYTEQSCNFAHSDTGYYPKPPGHDKQTEKKESELAGNPNLPKHLLTCYYWRKGAGSCKKGQYCQFAHHDTGHYASQPGTYRSRDAERSAQEEPAPSTLREGAADDELVMAHVDAPAADLHVSAGSHGMRILTDISDPETEQLKTQISSMGVNVPAEKSPEQMTAIITDRPENTDSPTLDRLDGAVSNKRLPLPDASDSRDRSQRRANTTPEARRMILDVFISGLKDPIRLAIHLTTDRQLAHELPASFDDRLELRQTILAGDFESFFWSAEKGVSTASHTEGRISVDPDSTASADILKDMCKLSASGMVTGLAESSSMLLVYPLGAEEWNFMAQTDSTAAPASRVDVFGFHIFAVPSNTIVPFDLKELGQDPDTRKTSEIIGAKILALQPERLLFKEEGKRIDVVFLMMPPSCWLEIEVYSQYFLDQGCKVYHSGMPGAWTYFRRKYGRACLVMIHPDVQLEKVPRLHEFISNFGNGARIFTIGVDPIASLTADESPAFDCVRLFPNGQVIYLTDEALLYHPDDSAHIVTFMASRNDRPLAHSKIVTRPDVKNWLLDLLSTKQDERYMLLYKAMCKLSSGDDDHKNGDTSGTSIPTSSLITIDGDTLPSASDMNTADRSDYLVNYFAGWAVAHASVWRTFLVCYEPVGGSTQMVADESGKMVLKKDGDPHQWGKRYQHLGIFTPKQMLDKFSNNN